ncbi:cell wall hydrolase [Novosphingobium resinovorum]|uniref:cell wall hydrolase n=1 Tax=Novosphingobium resinovorum TaxID=158500 RepID=UPI002ED024E7|nr:cell wall hydrolase [Novosphingobium resinovorum]
MAILLMMLASIGSLLLTVGHHRPHIPPERASGRASLAQPTAAVPTSRDALSFVDAGAQTARKINASTPFVAVGPDRPARLRISSEDPDYARALDCLASAVLYEAGEDREGQAAVAQVVVNRVHHPAFPHSICGVVYQGSERTTGCQFTFTCDGALAHPPTLTAWRRARDTAAAFLAGKTEPAIGLATHYHTDWVYPYWSASLDKIAQVRTHLFFKWRGSWGRKTSFTSPYADVEPAEPKLAFLSPAHAAQTPVAPTAFDAGSDPTVGEPILPALGGDHFIQVEGGGNGTALALEALSQCRAQTYCKVVGWDRAASRYGSPQNPVLRTVAFLYISDKRTGVELVLWDCTRFNRPADTQCLSKHNRRWITFQGDLSRAS